MTQTLSTHDHGNCALCDQLETELAILQQALRAKLVLFTTYRNTSKKALQKVQKAKNIDVVEYASRLAEVKTLNVCIFELKQVLAAVSLRPSGEGK